MGATVSVGSEEGSDNCAINRPGQSRRRPIDSVCVELSLGRRDTEEAASVVVADDSLCQVLDMQFSHS